MRLVVLCGMPSEKAVLEAALPGVMVLSGADKNDLAALVPADATHFASCGLFGGLSPTIQVADVVAASTVSDGAGHAWTADAAWTAAAVDAIRATPVDAGPAYPQVPAWAERAAARPWYSSGVMDQADAAPQRAALLAATGAWAIDDETVFLAALAARRGLPFVVVRACSDDASETLPLAVRGQIVNADGSPNLGYFLQQIFQESLGDTAQIPKIVAGFDASLAALAAAAPAVLSSISNP